MQAKTVFTKQLNAYRAGLDIGNNLKEIKPEVIFLFTSIHYEKNAEKLLNGIYDALENEKLILIGNSGDGVLTMAEDLIEIGATAIGINTNGKIKFSLKEFDGLSANETNRKKQEILTEAIDSCVEHIENELGKEKLSMLWLSMDFRIDAGLTVEMLNKKVRVPVVGALSGDDRKFEQAIVFANKRVLREGIAMLGADGDFLKEIYISTNSKMVGNKGVVTKTLGIKDNIDGFYVMEIDKMKALEFIEKEVGRELFLTEKGIMALMVFDAKNDAIAYKRSIIDFSYEGGEVKLLGSLENGERVQFCYTESKALLEGLASAEDIVNKDKESKFVSKLPAMALIVSCAGRKWMLEDGVVEEIRMVNRIFQGKVPVMGLMSFGELAPYKTNNQFSKNLFHNMTSILLLLGEG